MPVDASHDIEPLEGVLESSLYADDLDAAERFYGTTLGLERIAKVEDRHVFFRCGSGMVLIFKPDATMEPPSNPQMPVPPHGAKGPGHLCFRLPKGAMDDWVARLQAAGVAVEADFCWPNGARSFYFRDPAGNSLECAEARLWNL